MDTFVLVALASSVACGITTLGIVAISRWEHWAETYRVYFIAFAAGVLVTVALVHLVPRSAELSHSGPPLVLAGFFGLYLLNRLLHAHLHDGDQEPRRALGLVPMIGIGLHSLVDGVIYSVTFNVSIFTGLLAATGMVLHELPEGIVTFVLLGRGGYSRRRAMLYAFLAAGLSTPAGALASFPFISRLDERALGALLAISAGALTYVGATHLLPSVEEQDRPFATLALLAGVAFGLSVIWFHH